MKKTLKDSAIYAIAGALLLSLLMFLNGALFLGFFEAGQGRSTEIILRVAIDSLFFGATLGLFSSFFAALSYFFFKNGLDNHPEKTPESWLSNIIRNSTRYGLFALFAVSLILFLFGPVHSLTTGELYLGLAFLVNTIPLAIAYGALLGFAPVFAVFCICFMGGKLLKT